MNTVEVKVLEWDTAFFGARMARLDVVEMDETRLRLVEERCYCPCCSRRHPRM